MDYTPKVKVVSQKKKPVAKPVAEPVAKREVKKEKGLK